MYNVAAVVPSEATVVDMVAIRAKVWSATPSRFFLAGTTISSPGRIYVPAVSFSERPFMWITYFFARLASGAKPPQTSM